MAMTRNITNPKAPTRATRSETRSSSSSRKAYKKGKRRSATYSVGSATWPGTSRLRMLVVIGPPLRWQVRRNHPVPCHLSCIPDAWVKPPVSHIDYKIQSDDQNADD